MFRPTVAIIRFYPKLYAKRESLYNVRTTRIDFEISSSTCRAKFHSLWPWCGLCLVAGVFLWTEWYSLVRLVSLLALEVVGLCGLISVSYFLCLGNFYYRRGVSAFLDFFLCRL